MPGGGGRIIIPGGGWKNPCGGGTLLLLLLILWLSFGFILYLLAEINNFKKYREINQSIPHKICSPQEENERRIDSTQRIEYPMK